MTQSLVVYEDIRKNINMIDDIQHQEVDEALGDLVKKAKTYWAGREKRAGQRDLNYYVDQNFKWLGLLMGRQDIDWTELSFGNMRHFFKAPRNRIGLDDADVDEVFAKVQKKFNLPNTKDGSNINDDEPTSQAIVKGLLKQGIVQAQAKQGLGSSSQKASAATGAAGDAPVPTAASSTPSQTPPTAPTSQAAATAAAAPKEQKPFDKNKPDLVVDIKGQPTKVWKVPVSTAAPAGWIYWNAVDKLWVKPAPGSKDAEWFDDYWTTKKMTEAVSTKSEINDRLNHLGAARQAEKQGDKALQYEKLADYHTEFSKVNKLKPADRIHHTTQAGIYRNAAQAVRSAQETLAKSSK